MQPALPERVPQHGDLLHCGRRERDVRRLNETPEDRTDAELRVDIACDGPEAGGRELSREFDALHRPPRSHDRLERRRLFELSKQHVRRADFASIAGDRRHPHERPGIAHGEIAQDERVQQAEERRVRADRERRCQDGRGGEHRGLPIDAQRITDVLEERMDGRERADVAARLGRLRDAAKRDPRRASRLGRRHPSIDVVLRGTLEMILELLRQPGVQATGGPSRAEPGHECAQGHEAHRLTC